MMGWVTDMWAHTVSGSGRGASRRGQLAVRERERGERPALLGCLALMANGPLA